MEKKEVICSACGASVVFDEKGNRDTCNYCGAMLDLSNASTRMGSDEVKEAAQSAEAFEKALVVEVNGNKASICDMWESLVSNKSVGKDDLVKFNKNLKARIRFCIDIFNSLSNEIKYELGEHICTQMQSIIRFRITNGLIYLDELDDIDVLISKQEYEMGARSFFQFKRKWAIKKKIERIKARRVVLMYDYVTQAMEAITAEYNSHIEPLKTELNATSAHARRKAIKEKITLLEAEKKREIDALGVAEATKAYNKVVKTYKIKHENTIGKQASADDNFSVSSVAAVAPKKAVVDYTTFSVVELIDMLNESIEKLAKSITTSETKKCKAIKDALMARAGEFEGEGKVYYDAVMMSVNMIFSNEHPAVMSAMINNTKGNIAMQSATLKSKIGK